MWIAIFGLAIVMAVAGFACLCNRVYRFMPPHDPIAAKRDKYVRMFASADIILIVTLVFCIALGAVNAVIILIHLVVFWLLSDVVFFVIKKIRGRAFVFNFSAAVAMLTTLVYLTVGFFSANNVWVARYEIETDKAVGNLRIILFADSHIGTTFDGEGFAEHVKTMQSHDPDIVVIAGDFVDDDTSLKDMETACRALGTLKTTYGVFYAFGNHDKGYYDDSHRSYSGADLIGELEKNGVTVLQDESKPIGDGFIIIGRQEAEESRRGGKPRVEIGELTDGIDNDKFSIVINHQPTDYANEAKSGVDLVLSGHTHGGQMFPIGFVSDLFNLNDSVYGLTHRGNTDFIVTSGISDWAFRFKTGCRSEFVIVDVKGK